MAISSQGTTFSFSGLLGLAGSVVSISVEEAQPEFADMTSATDLSSVKRLMLTGDITAPPKVSIEYLRSATNLSGHPPTSMTGIGGTLAIGHLQSGVSVIRNAFVESASTEMTVGDAIRGKITFVIDTTIP